MDETTVFKGNVSEPQRPAAPPPPTPPSPTSPPQAPPPVYLEEEKKFPALTVVKFLIGLVVVAIVGFLISIFVLPNFTQKEEDGKTRLTYWGLFETESIMNSLILDFEKENPEVDVVYEKQDIKQYREKLATRIANGTGPDVFRFHNTWAPQLTDILLPLPSDVMEVSEFKKVFYPVAQQDLVREGAVFGIPLEVDTLALYVNSDHLTAQNLAPPSNWIDFINTSRLLTVKDQNAKILTAGAAMGTYDNITHAPDLISLLFIQNGVDLYNISQNRERASDAISFYTSFTLSDGNVWDQTLDNSLLSFSKGSLAIHFGYLRDFFAIKGLNSSLLFEVAPVPQLPERKINIASYWVEGVSLKSKNQEAALAFLKFLSEKETQQKLYNAQFAERGVGQIPGRADLGDSLGSGPLTNVFVDQAKDATSTFFSSDTFDEGLNTKMNSYLAEAINSVLGGGQINSVLDTLIQKISAELASY